MQKDKEAAETIKKELTYLQKVWNTVGIVALLVWLSWWPGWLLTYC
jgi:hypothetical protein